jgi:hypothetical protein
LGVAGPLSAAFPEASAVIGVDGFWGEGLGELASFFLFLLPRRRVFLHVFLQLPFWERMMMTSPMAVLAWHFQVHQLFAVSSFLSSLPDPLL